MSFVDMSNNGKAGPRLSNVIFVQPELPEYRRSFFERLHTRFGNRLEVYASGRNVIDVHTEAHTVWLRPLGKWRSLAPGLKWQSGALQIRLYSDDVVVISGAPRGISNMALMLKAKRARCTVVWWGHYWSATSRRWRAKLRFLLMRLADAIMFYTESEVGRYLAQHPRAPTPVYSLSNGIDGEPIAQLRLPYSAAQRGHELLFIGRLTRKAELHLLLKALAEPCCLSYRLHVIGDGECARSLKQTAESLHVNNRVHWHGTELDERRIAVVANRCRLFVYPGAVGLSLIHAMNYGLPALVHDRRSRHMPEIDALSPGRNGGLFAYRDHVSLSRSLNALMQDEPRLDAMSAVALETTRSSYNVAVMVERFCRMLDDIGKTRPTAVI